MESSRFCVYVRSPLLLIKFLVLKFHYAPLRIIETSNEKSGWIKFSERVVGYIKV